MKKIVFDSSSIISIVTNDLLGTLKLLKQNFDVEFYIPESVKLELIDKALNTNKYKLEGIILSRAIRNGVLKVYPALEVNNLLNISNKIYIQGDYYMHILDKGEIEALAIAIKLDADAYCVDERTMRLIIEDPNKLKKIFSNKLQKNIKIDSNNLKEFRKLIKNVPIIRSSEIMIVAFENGLFDKYISNDIPKELVLEALLWGLRLRGCSISTEDINEIIKLKRK